MGEGTENSIQDDGPILLFDGVCNLCVGSVQFVIRHDRQATFRFASLQSPSGQQLYARAGFSGERLDTFMVVRGNRSYVRSDAALEVVRELGGVWKCLLMFKWIPRAWRDHVYDLVARNRYRWFGRRESCLVPSEQLRQRFLS